MAELKTKRFEPGDGRIETDLCEKVLEIIKRILAKESVTAEEWTTVMGHVFHCDECRQFMAETGIEGGQKENGGS